MNDSDRELRNMYCSLSVHLDKKEWRHAPEFFWIGDLNCLGLVSVVNNLV